MRPAVRRPVITVVRDPRGLLCSGCGAVVPSAVRMAQTHGFLVLCAGCLGDAAKRLPFITNTQPTTEG